MAIINKDLGPVTAYALALKNGFEGSEVEWLDSLRGEPGDVSEAMAQVNGALNDIQNEVRDMREQLSGLPEELEDKEGAFTSRGGVMLSSGNVIYKHLLVPVSGYTSFRIAESSENTNNTFWSFLTDSPEPLSEHTEDGIAEFKCEGAAFRVLAPGGRISDAYSGIPEDAEYLIVTTAYAGAVQNMTEFTLTDGEGRTRDLLAERYRTIFDRAATLEDEVEQLRESKADARPVYPIENPALRAYLALEDYASDPEYEYSHVKPLLNVITTYPFCTSKPESVTPEIEGYDENEDYILICGDRRYENSGSSFVLKNLIPNRVYNYSVYKKESGAAKTFMYGGVFETSGRVRMIDADTVFNMRDLGGNFTSDGKKVKYGLVYRGGELDGASSRGILSPTGRAIFNSLGIETEIDLDTAASEGAQVLKNYFPYPVVAYQTGLGSGSSRVNYLQALNKINECAKKGIPVYFHCQAGKDRTGTLALLLLGLLGVREDQISLDYELSTFNHMQDRSIGPGHSSIAARNTYTITDSGGNVISSDSKYKDTVAWLKTFTGDTFKEKVENYLLDAGLGAEVIESLRANLLEEEI